ncbi:MAG: precorrin-6A synthase (deacetylating) [Ornithinimicrobium sp.]
MSPAARRVFVIGIGAGSPKHLSVEAIEALQVLDVVLVADKGAATADLVGAREAICEQFIDGPQPRIIAVPDPQRAPSATHSAATAYTEVVLDWHAERARRYGQIIADLPESSTVGFLVWGDPAFYDSTIRIVDAIASSQDLEVTVIPGISAFQALAAAHRIVLHDVGMPIHITTGRRLLQEWSPDLGSVVVMLDGQFAATELAGSQPDLRIYWGAYLGLDYQELRHGRLADVAEQIATRRRELREDHGWIMDTYVLMT